GPPMRTRPPPASRRASPAASASRGRAPGRGSSGPAVVAVGGAQVVPLRSLAVAAGELPVGVVAVEVVDGGAVDLVGGQPVRRARCHGVLVGVVAGPAGLVEADPGGQDAGAAGRLRGC